MNRSDTSPKLAASATKQTTVTDMQQNSPPSEFRTLRGQNVVLGMLAFGIVMVAAMWLYWEMYTRPFRPLQNAIHAEFPGSSPRVVGGRHKSHKEGSPHLLRIVIRVDFDPETADETILEDHVNRLRSLAGQHLDLSPYERIEIHLIQRVPEKATRQRSFEVPLRDSAAGGARPESRSRSEVVRFCRVANTTAPSRNFRGPECRLSLRERTPFRGAKGDSLERRSFVPAYSDGSGNSPRHCRGAPSQAAS